MQVRTGDRVTLTGTVLGEYEQHKGVRFDGGDERINWVTVDALAHMTGPGEYGELVKRLRTPGRVYTEQSAADAIESLVRERDEAQRKQWAAEADAKCSREFMERSDRRAETAEAALAKMREAFETEWRGRGDTDVTDAMLRAAVVYMRGDASALGRGGLYRAMRRAEIGAVPPDLPYE